LTAGPAAADPTVDVSARAAAVGDTVLVTLQGWPSTATVSVCGNAAKRGAVDCDQVGAVGVSASLTAPQHRALLITRPPAPCPCAVRTAGAGEQPVATTPIDIVGLPTAPVVDEGAPTASLRLSASVVDGASSFFAKLQSALGGRTRRTLVLTLTNQTDTLVDGMSGTAAVCRTAQGGEPLQLPTIGALARGQTMTYRVPVSLSAPSFGYYVVYGSIYGGGPPLAFAADTHTQPWGLFVLLVVLVLDIGVIWTVRVRRRQEGARSLPPTHGKETSRQTAVEQTSKRASRAHRPSMVTRDADPYRGTARADAPPA